MADEIEREEERPQEMVPLHPDHVWVLRIRFLAFVAAATVAAFVLDMGPARDFDWAPAEGRIPLAVLALLLLLAWYWPRRRYNAWGWREEEDELHIRHGLLVRMRTAVPFGRVQHIDVAQGPLQRAFGLATLVLHTAGTRGASVTLPGLAPDDANGLRDRIRAKIRQDLL